jgi:hypothetical protein
MEAFPMYAKGLSLSLSVYLSLCVSVLCFVPNSHPCFVLHRTAHCC